MVGLTHYACRVGQSHIYAVFKYEMFGRKNTKYMVKYGAYI